MMLSYNKDLGFDQPTRNGFRSSNLQMYVKAHCIFIAERTGDIIGGALSKMKMCHPLFNNN